MTLTCDGPLPARAFDPPAARAAAPGLLGLEAVSWGPAGRAAILDDLTFSVPKGQILAICGANGAGKTSLLRLLYRNQAPTRGKVMLQGRDLWSLPAAAVARQVAVVLQEQPSDLGMTVAQIVALGRLPHRRGWGAALSGPSRHDAAVCAAALERMDLAPLAQRALGTLSGGERQRVMVARALAQEPEVIVLDEPTNHLDIRHQLELLALLRDLGRTVIATLHDLSLAAGFADRVILLHRGRILSDGPPQLAMTEATLSAAFDIRARVDASGTRPRFDFHL